MAENVVDRIVAELRAKAAECFPGRGEARNVRVVGHTPKPDHFIHEIVVDFEVGSVRLAAKVFRGAKSGTPKAISAAKTENDSLQYVHATFQRKRLEGVPRPIGDFSWLGAVVSEKHLGVPLQSLIMKAALLPGYAENGTLSLAATMTGHWLRNFHKATADGNEPFDSSRLLTQLETLCKSCRSEGLDDEAVRTIMAGSKKALSSNRKTLPASAVLAEFTPLNVSVGEAGVSVCDFARMKKSGSSLEDAAQFLACIEALEKYPFCNRAITAMVQDCFLEAYGASASDRSVLRVLKMRELLAMFAQGRAGAKESAVRKKVMWANVMKRFIQQAAQRAMAPAA
jgi:hypothetical protein